jgi:Domain of unknown function (DUF3291)
VACYAFHVTEPQSHIFHLAQINIARARAPLTDPLMASFVEQLDAINALAEQSPGFVWRLKGEDGSPSSYIGDPEDDRILVNMSVWTTMEALHNYVYKSAHGKAFADRRQWFEPLGRPAVALWWIRHDGVPTLEDGRRRLALLNARGPSADAFTFKQQFAPPLLGQDLVHE